MNAIAGPLPAWARLSADGRSIALTLYLQPSARTNAVAGPHGDALKLRITAPATDNRANEALLEFLQEELAVPRAALRIARGRTSRRKIVELSANLEHAARRLRIWNEHWTD